MVNKYSKKIIFLSMLLVFFLSSQSAFALVLVDTENVSINATVGGPVAPGGSSGTMGIPKTAVRFSGQAYPFATVYILKEGTEVVSVLADSLGSFSATLEESYNANILYSLYAKDVAGNRSLLINYPIVVYMGYLTHLSGIRFAPTINTDKAEVKVGDFLTVSGYALPKTVLQITIEGQQNNQKKVFSLTSHENGFYTINIPLGDTPKGNYIVQAKYVDDTRVSKSVQFIIGEVNILNVDAIASIPGDCNKDKIINLVDFSVLAFWYGKKNPPVCVDTNRDKIINLVDFSILAFYWTG